MKPIGLLGFVFGCSLIFTPACRREPDRGSGGASMPATSTGAPPVARGTEDAMAGVSQVIVIEASSVDQLRGLHLIDVRGLSLPDHPHPTPVDGGRIILGGEATDEAVAILRERGCMPERACSIRVIETKEEGLRRWQRIGAQIDHGDGGGLR